MVIAVKTFRHLLYWILFTTHKAQLDFHVVVFHLAFIVKPNEGIVE